ncbi:UNVERIFIED_CONTAM: hypothetical protein Sindi_3059400, partial [Sesamum indicum]
MENGGGDLEAKIEMLLNVEKQMRQVGDVAGTRKAVTPLAILLLTPQQYPSFSPSKKAKAGEGETPQFHPPTAKIPSPNPTITPFPFSS